MPLSVVQDLSALGFWTSWTWTDLGGCNNDRLVRDPRSGGSSLRGDHLTWPASWPPWGAWPSVVVALSLPSGPKPEPVRRPRQALVALLRVRRARQRCRTGHATSGDEVPRSRYLLG